MPLTILVADDDLGTRLSIGDYLESIGYSVISAQNGRDALRLVEESQPHLIVTDITMPQMDGYELVRQIRQRPILRLLPVIFLTGRTATDEKIRGYQLGCDVYLEKPFELPELGAIVRNLLERLQMIEQEWRRTAALQPTVTGILQCGGDRPAQPDPTGTGCAEVSGGWTLQQPNWRSASPQPSHGGKIRQQLAEEN